MDNLILQQAADDSVKLIGQLTFDNAKSVYRQGKSLLSRNVRTFDLAELTHSDSSGLAVLLAWQQDAENLQIDLEYQHIPKQMQAMASLCEVSNILNIAEK